MARNVLGGELQTCSTDPMTGFYRTGCCETGAEDVGVHTVCAQMTAEFLEFSAAQGNDLSTPRPEFGFAGLKPGDRWCVCADRWVEAYEAGVAPPVVLEATHASMLDWVDLSVLQRHAVPYSRG
ncbi:hypothetical protein SAMN05443637_101200 [Pseudonocardia thermophila]|jgi:Uncharacterized protein conserved in bacteria|uniref:DUF2237 domain-containing protein n=1 Tax=Pseudonocardia thermophila TaxID=1848 RepID=A0A1M6NE20_PSETH|nr:DUF2237 domain-containing protein [Pseudonocardia thermophila]SHJ93940.1 hypothetical protein SAMN05443637_101200 [Pseudonocardia thermophila]